MNPDLNVAQWEQYFDISIQFYAMTWQEKERFRLGSFLERQECYYRIDLAQLCFNFDAGNASFWCVVHMKFYQGLFLLKFDFISFKCTDRNVTIYST